MAISMETQLQTIFEEVVVCAFFVLSGKWLTLANLLAFGYNKKSFH